METRRRVSPSLYLARRLQQGDTVFFTGAGMSTASGLPDFRSPGQGLWGTIDPIRCASLDSIRSHYSEFLSFNKSMIAEVWRSSPNRGHHLIAEWENRGFVTGVITQNVDGFHRAAGSRTVACIHGDLSKAHCMSCGSDRSVADFMNDAKCPCGGLLRPSVVLFGEDLAASETDLAARLIDGATTFVVLGSSLTVKPACWYPRRAHERGAKLVIVNRERTPLDSIADMVVRDPLGDYLEAVQKVISTRRTSDRESI
jgi:NAD-dependent deacetylase